MVDKKVVAQVINDNVNVSQVEGKCSKLHIADLPGDLRTTDVDVLQSRLDATNETFHKI